MLEQSRAELAGMREEKTKSTLACAQAQSDSIFLKDKMESMRSTQQAINNEVNALRSRTSLLQGQVGACESKVSEYMKEAVTAKEREQLAREATVGAQAAQKHAESRISQLEADLTGIKSEKTQIHNLMAHVKGMHEEDAKRYQDDLARVNRDRERKEKDWTDARAELAKERSRADEMRVTAEHKMAELRTALCVSLSRPLALSRAQYFCFPFFFWVCAPRPQSSGARFVPTFFRSRGHLEVACVL